MTIRRGKTGILITSARDRLRSALIAA